jgi:hypothetical protein
MPNTSRPSVDQLKRALKITEQIQQLESELASILGNTAAEAPKIKRAYNKKSDSAAPVKPEKKKRSKMSAESREKIAAAQRLRWAKQKKAAKKE